MRAFFQKIALICFICASLCGCSKTPTDKIFVSFAVMDTKAPMQPVVSFFDLEGNEIAHASGETIPEAWAGAQSNSRTPFVYDVMDTVLMNSNASYEEIVAAGTALEDSGYRFPSICFFSADTLPEEPLSLISERKRESRCDLNQVLSNEGAIVLPSLEKRDCCVLARSGNPSQRMEGTDAEFAKLLSGETSSFRTEIPDPVIGNKTFESSWVIRSYDAFCSKNATMAITMQLDFLCASVERQQVQTLSDTEKEALRVLLEERFNAWVSRTDWLQYDGRMKAQILTVLGQGNPIEESLTAHCRFYG